jgi:hypothetical protein
MKSERTVRRTARAHAAPCLTEPRMALNTLWGRSSRTFFSIKIVRVMRSRDHAIIMVRRWNSKGLQVCINYLRNASETVVAGSHHLYWNP